jgi:hypothetical protein
MAAADRVHRARRQRRQYAVIVKVNLKSLIWYNTRGLRALLPGTPAADLAPRTWSGLLSLADAIAGQGTAPWCLGMGANGALPWTDLRIPAGVGAVRRHRAGRGGRTGLRAADQFG